MAPCAKYIILAISIMTLLPFECHCRRLKNSNSRLVNLNLNSCQDRPREPRHHFGSPNPSPNDLPNGTVWPQPQFIQYRPTVITVTPWALSFESTYKCDILDKAFQRYRKLIFPPLPPGYGTPEQESDEDLSFTALYVTVNEPCDQYPHLGMNENYRLDVFENGTGLLQAQQIWGALRGLETFSQLIYSPTVGTYAIRAVSVNDFPRFSWRGVLLDTSRHYVSVSVLKENIEIMAQNKFNVFHWHIVDDQSFPYQSQTFPDLSAKGAYSNRHVYTQQDIAQIVEHGRLRGVRIVPEFDSPGHLDSWAKGQPSLLAQCYKDGAPTDERHLVDPTVTSTFDFLYALFTEIFQRFPDTYIHLGGDEVQYFTDCWKTNPRVQRFMQLMNYTDFNQLVDYYFSEFLPLLLQIRPEAQFVAWSEVFLSNVKVPVAKTIGQAWRNVEELGNITLGGSRALLSSCWYLDYMHYGTDEWHGYYACDPHNFTGTQAQKNLVIGGEACLWGEYVDGTNLTPRLWPRASPIAERLWSAQTVTDTDNARLRLNEHQCRMIARGYAAEPINGPSFCPIEWNSFYR